MNRSEKAKLKKKKQFVLTFAKKEEDLFKFFGLLLIYEHYIQIKIQMRFHKQFGHIMPPISCIHLLYNN